MKSKKLLVPLSLCLFVFGACDKELATSNSQENEVTAVAEDPSTFKLGVSVDLGGEAASEISAYDATTKRLFVVNNEADSKVDVIDLSKYPVVNKLQSIELGTLGGFANSVAAFNGLVAIALEAINKQDNGKLIIVKASDLSTVKQITVGALPDMVTFSPDGNYIVSANEGEPSADYTNDPKGSVSIICVKENYSVKTIDFSGFEGSKAKLLKDCFRVFGPNASLAQDVEPEYATITSDSKRAWVTLQENNGMAEVDLASASILRVIPLGVKDISKPQFKFDVSDEDGKIELGNWPVRAYYLPDAISYFNVGGAGYVALANEGDTREYDAYEEEERVKDLILDPARFPNASFLKEDENLGRLTVTTASGDTDGDGDYDILFVPGARSFSIRSTTDGKLIADVGKELEERVIASGNYDDGRSDNKGVEVEGITVAKIGNRPIAFVGMERADMIAIYDLSDPASPKFLQLFKTGDAPEGILYIKPEDSPNGRSLLVICSEDDGDVSFYQPDQI